MTREEVHERLKEIVVDILETDDRSFGDDDDFVADLDMDSLQAVSMLIQIERRFKVRLPETEMGQMRTVRSVANLVLENLESH